MNKLFFTLSTASLMLMPTAALAAFDTPGKLITSIQEQSGRSFQMSVHSQQKSTYVSVWANGASEGTTPEAMKLRTNATVDVVQGDMKVRAKGEVLVLDGSLFLKLNALQGNYTSAFGSFAINGYQKQWLTIPFNGEISPLLSESVTLDLGSIDAGNADAMYTLQHVMSNGINIYTLNLAPDYAPELALKLRSMLGDTEPVSNDFFPWRELAEGIHYELIIRTDSKDRFLSSTLTLNTGTKDANYSATISEKAMAGSMSISRPAKAVNIEEVLGMVLPSNFADDMDTSSVMEENSLAEDGATFDSVETEVSTPTETMSNEVDPACVDPSLTALSLLSLQRSGVCPVGKISTRFVR